MLGTADFSGAVLDQLELQDESDKVTLEVLLFGPDGTAAVSYGKADCTLPPGDGAAGTSKDESVNIAASDGGSRAQVHIKTSWVD